jgi:hypothetical protein
MEGLASRAVLAIVHFPMNVQQTAFMSSPRQVRTLLPRQADRGVKFRVYSYPTCLNIGYSTSHRRYWA